MTQLGIDALIVVASSAHGRLQRSSVRAREVGADDVLTLVLAAAEDPEVRPVRVERHPPGERAHLDRDVSPANTTDGPSSAICSCLRSSRFEMRSDASARAAIVAAAGSSSIDPRTVGGVGATRTPAVTG